MRRIDLPVSKELSGRTVEEILRKNGISRRLIVKLKRTDGGITVDGKAARTIDTASFGQTVSIAVSDDKSPQEANPNLKVNIVYEDDDLIVFDKPADMPVHPSHKHRLDTLGNAFACVCPGLAFRPINRLDRGHVGTLRCRQKLLCRLRLCGKNRKGLHSSCMRRAFGRGQNRRSYRKRAGEHHNPMRQGGWSESGYKLQGFSLRRALHSCRVQAGNGQDSSNPCSFRLYRSSSCRRRPLRL